MVITHHQIYYSTSLAWYLDKKVLILCLDGRTVLGKLCSYDQFANLVLKDSYERVVVGDLYCDIPVGLYVIRGENVALIGQHAVGEPELPSRMTSVSESEIKRAQKAEREAMELRGRIKKHLEFLDFD